MADGDSDSSDWYDELLRPVATDVVALGTVVAASTCDDSRDLAIDVLAVHQQSVQSEITLAAHLVAVGTYDPLIDLMIGVPPPSAQSGGDIASPTGFENCSSLIEEGAVPQPSGQSDDDTAPQLVSAVGTLIEVLAVPCSVQTDIIVAAPSSACASFPLIDGLAATRSHDVSSSTTVQPPHPMIDMLAVPHSVQSGLPQVEVSRARSSADSLDAHIRSVWWHSLVPNGIRRSMAMEHDIMLRFPISAP